MRAFFSAVAMVGALCVPALAEEAAAPRPAMLAPEAHGDWQAIGRVNVTGYRRRSACSGTLIAPDRVLTAAHCVFRGDRPAAVGDIRFAAGWFRGTAAAVGRVRVVTLIRGWTPGRTGIDAVFRDVAVLDLAAPVGGIAPLPLSAGGGGAMRILGYRWDRPHALSDHAPCGGVARFAPALGLTCGVAQGTSGAPVLAREGGGWAVIGVTSARSGGLTLAAPVARGDFPAP